MIVAHLSDLHLGHRAFGRSDRGQNRRELDLAAAFQRAVQSLVELAPDLIVVSGDIFDRPDPPAGALVTLSRSLERLGSELSSTPVLLTGGARDAPRRPGDLGALSAMDAFPHVEAATSTARSVLFRDRSLHVQLIPHRALLGAPAPVLEPDPRARWNVLVVYGHLAGAESSPEPALALSPEGWDYIALGSAHSHRIVRDRVAYAGALERVGPAPWAEAGEEKGFLSVDLSSGDITFHPVPGRPVVALAPTRVPPGERDVLRARILEVVSEVPGGIDGKIVRIRLKGPTPSDLAALQGPFLVDLADRALHLSLEVEDEGAPPGVECDIHARVQANLPADAPAHVTDLLRSVLRGGAGEEGLGP